MAADEEPCAQMRARRARSDAHQDMLAVACEDRKRSRFAIVQSLRSNLAALGAQLDDLDELDLYARKQIHHATVRQKHLAGLKSEVARLKAENHKLRKKCAALEQQQQPAAELQALERNLLQLKAEQARICDVHAKQDAERQQQLADQEAQIWDAKQKAARLERELNEQTKAAQHYRNLTLREVEEEKARILSEARAQEKWIVAQNQRLLQDANVKARRIVMDARQQMQERTEYWDELTMQRKQNAAASKRIGELERALHEARGVNGQCH